VAGIGWKLERLLDRGSLGSALGAYLTGVAVTSGPWLLTTLVLVAMRASAASAGLEGVDDVQVVITIVYATVLVLSAPIDIVLSRYASDRMYERKPERIAAPLRRTLGAALAGFAASGAVLATLLGFPDLAAGTAILTVIVGGQWLLLSAAGGLSAPRVILVGFAAGAPASIIGSLALARTDLGAAGHLYGFAAGQAITLVLLLLGTLRALPREEDESARIAPAFRTYWLLAAAATALHAGIWIDKVVMWALHGAAAASTYAALAALAWLTVVPACGYLFVQVETRFYRRFRSYYGAIENGAALDELETAAMQLERDAVRILAATFALQAGVTLLALLVAGRALDALGFVAMGGTAVALMIGAMLQIVSLCATLLLHYFDLRREGMAAAAALLVGNGVFTWALDGIAPAGTGYALACGLSSVLAIVLLRRRMATLLRDTFQSQPYGA